MFYSESLLAKTGPLARVWLASNFERKLNKQNILSSNLENNVKDIIGQGQAPMALRLSGQLLLGVVRIYSRKARYLLEDCSDALLKIKVVSRLHAETLRTRANSACRPSDLAMSTFLVTKHTLPLPARLPSRTPSQSSTFSHRFLIPISSCKNLLVPYAAIRLL